MELGNSEVPKTLSKVARERVTSATDNCCFLFVCMSYTMYFQMSMSYLNYFALDFRDVDVYLKCCIFSLHT